MISATGLKLVGASLATLWSASSFRPVSRTLNPPAANSSASALPIPEEAPVMMAHLRVLLIDVQVLVAGAEEISRIEALFSSRFH